MRTSRLLAAPRALAASPGASAARGILHRRRPRPRRLSAEGRESVWGRKEFRSRASASLIPHFPGLLPRPLSLSLPSSPISLTLASFSSHSFFLPPVPAAHVRSSQVDRALALQQVAFALRNILKPILTKGRVPAIIGSLQSSLQRGPRLVSSSFAVISYTSPQKPAGFLHNRDCALDFR